MGAELLLAVVVVALDRSVLDRAVHPLDLPIRPRVPRLGRLMVDLVEGTGRLESVGPEGLTGCNCLLNDRGGRDDVSGCREVGAVIVSTV